ncbi:MAG TPA: NAD(P)-dependent alcohol dehydrogenase, partial [Isosphaeraceae bacterium]|nr:NAD(P)-dependent alcohol dehydrogenase [Isosphaeraceae bacterium]
VHVPEHLSDEEAACLPCAGLTAWNALFGHTPIKPGDTVLTLGTGGVSVFAVQFAHMAGARVISTSSSEEKLSRVRELGASETINYKAKPEWHESVLKLTDGLGVDHVVEVGGSGTLGRSLRSVRMGGAVSMIGVLTQGDVNVMLILMKSVRLQGIYVGSRSMFQDMNRALSQHKSKPVVDRIFPFSEARAAYEYLRSGSHFGKVVIRVGS